MSKQRAADLRVPSDRDRTKEVKARLGVSEEKGGAMEKGFSLKSLKGELVQRSLGKTGWFLDVSCEPEGRGLGREKEGGRGREGGRERERRAFCLPAIWKLSWGLLSPP